mmetsp:Transcript_20559/g.48057  ORF Transcript_20559/g.48057 Transcript_20559/m.48057 type:complete len:278 (-) Transcript_20559:80-913(-)
MLMPICCATLCTSRICSASLLQNTQPKCLRKVRSTRRPLRTEARVVTSSLSVQSTIFSSPCTGCKANTAESSTKRPASIEPRSGTGSGNDTWSGNWFLAETICTNGDSMYSRGVWKPSLPPSLPSSSLSTDVAGNKLGGSGGSAPDGRFDAGEDGWMARPLLGGKGRFSIRCLSKSKGLVLGLAPHRGGTMAFDNSSSNSSASSGVLNLSEYFFLSPLRCSVTLVAESRSTLDIEENAISLRRSPPLLTSVFKSVLRVTVRSLLPNNEGRLERIVKS